MDYLAVCSPVDLPVAIGGIDYQVSEGAGTLWQLAVLPALQSRGLGTLLIRAAEQRIRDRGLSRAELAVEEDNPRTRALYERLGYVAYGHAPDAWDQEEPDGSIRRYEMLCVLMRHLAAGEADHHAAARRSVPDRLVCSAPEGSRRARSRASYLAYVPTVELQTTARTLPTHSSQTRKIFGLNRLPT